MAHLEKFVVRALVQMIPPLARREMTRAVTKFPVALRVHPLKSTNCPKHKGFNAASLATERGPPCATMMFGQTKNPKEIGMLPTAIGAPSTVFVAVLITETVPSLLLVT